MKTRTLFCLLVILLLLFSSSLSLGADKKLGYGFAPGLVAGKDFVAGQLIVGLKQGMSASGIKQAASAAGVQVAKEIEGALLLQFASEEAVLSAVPRLLSHLEVAFVERNGFMHIPPKPTLPSKCGGCARSKIRLQSVSTDVLTGYQWHLTVIRKTATDLPAPATDPPTVAVVDTGVDYIHPDLAPKVLLGKNCVADNYDPNDDHGHGTHVAGLIGAEAGNGIYGEGVCPNCKILAIKVLGADGYGTLFDVAAGMQYARTYSNASYPPVKVINMSLGGPESDLIEAEVVAIKDAGKVLVAAAGNDSTTDPTDAYPGADPNTALRVMATNEVDCRAWFSNFSPAATPTLYNISAPGWNIYSTLPDGGFGTLSGTSMATPIVAGAAALVWGENPALTSDELVSRLVTNGKVLGCGFAAAAPRLDVRKAILTTPETAIVGRIVDPFTGKAPSPATTSTNARLYSGTSEIASDTTDRGGSYEMTGLTAGTSRRLKGDRTGYITSTLRNPITISSGVVAGPYLDAVPQARAKGYATIILDWKTTQPALEDTDCTGSCLGWELDLWIKTPSGDYVDPYFNSGDLLTSPYVKSPRDSYNDFLETETIVIAPPAENGVYKVFVDNPGGGGLWNGCWTKSLASAQVFRGGSALSGFYSGPPSACGCTYRYWYLGDLTKSGTSYTWTNKNSCTNTQP